MKVALTGNIGSGKSVAGEFFQQKGITVIDTDKIARDVVEPGEKALAEVVEVFGKDLLEKDGTLNRKKLGSIVFADEEKRKKLEAILHPAIWQRLQKDMDWDNERLVIAEVPLLFEANWQDRFDKIILIKAEDNVRLKRIMKRDDLSEEEAKKRLESQMSQEEKEKRADFVVDNSGDWLDTLRHLEDIWRILEVKMRQIRIALVAHDRMKPQMVKFARKHVNLLRHLEIVTTGTTGKLIEENTGLSVEKMLSGPYGGDQQIGAKIASGQIDLVIFMRDPLTAQPHEPDISALLRVCDVHNIPVATNEATAETLLVALTEEFSKHD